MFPQLGAPVGFFFATTIFLVLAHFLGDDAFMSWGWRVPFLASAVLVIFGLFIRLKITETPEFAKAIEKAERVEVPFFDVFKSHKLSLLLGTMAALATFVLFYIMTVFSLSYGTSALGYSREEFLILQMVGVLFFGLFIPLAAVLADRFGMRRVMVGVSIGIAIFGLVLAPLLGAGNVFGVLGFLCIGFALMGMTYGPLGTALAAPFPTAVRYTGASLTFNLGGIFGASFAPYIATWLASTYGLHTVGYYMIIAAVITLLAFGFIRQTSE
jgi:MFS family permease